jgi:hypothetical protein
MCAIAKFLFFSTSSIFDIVMINDKSTHLFVELLVYYTCMLGSRKYVSKVLRYNLLADSLTLWVVWYIVGVTGLLSPLQSTPQV